MQQPTSTEFSDPEQHKKKAGQPVQPAQVDQTHVGNKINKNFIERTRWTIFMLLIFVTVMAAGQTTCLIIILFSNYLIFKQINSIKRNYEKQTNIPITKYLSWFFYALANYYCFGNFILQTFPIIALNNSIFNFLLTNHSFLCFCAFIAGFVTFVMSLKQGYLKYQFRLFAWIMLATIMVVFQSWLMIANVFRGMIWFVIPFLLVVCNDIFAYLVGYFFGSHQLIALSPKKTWEGYIGGAIFTFIFSYILTSTLITIPGFACPMTTLSFRPFSYPQCNDAHITHEVYRFSFIPVTFMISHIHVFVLSLFASIVGPFGGFFASGLKRSIKIKDFSNLIPGHGGISDRMDCQLFMGSFAYFYLGSFLNHLSFDPTLFLSKLTYDQQAALLTELLVRFSK